MHSILRSSLSSREALRMRQLKGLRKERPGRHPLGVRLREYKSLRGRDLQEAGSFAFLAGKGACEHASSVTFATAVRRWCPSTESRLQELSGHPFFSPTLLTVEGS